MKSNRFVYDQLRDIYDLICIEEYKKKNPPEKPIKKLNFGKGRPVQPGRDIYASPSNNLSRIRLQQKDWDEAVEQITKKKTLKEFRADAGVSTTTPIKINKKNEDFLYQCFLAAQRFDNFDDFAGFVRHIS